MVKNQASKTHKYYTRVFLGLESRPNGNSSDVRRTLISSPEVTNTSYSTLGSLNNNHVRMRTTCGCIMQIKLFGKTDFVLGGSAGWSSPYSLSLRRRRNRETRLHFRKAYVCSARTKVRTSKKTANGMFLLKTLFRPSFYPRPRGRPRERRRVSELSGLWVRPETFSDGHAANRISITPRRRGDRKRRRSDEISRG